VRLGTVERVRFDMMPIDLTAPRSGSASDQPLRKVWPFNAGPIDFADALHGWMVVSESEPPCPQPPGGGHTVCDYAYAPAQHLVATNDGGATWTELP
jgi:hypothetical protein